MGLIWISQLDLEVNLMVKVKVESKVTDICTYVIIFGLFYRTETFIHPVNGPWFFNENNVPSFHAYSEI